MRDLVAETASSIDRRLARLAVELTGSPQAAVALLGSLALGPLNREARAFLQEAGALIRARRLLSEALAAAGQAERAARMDDEAPTPTGRGHSCPA